MSDWKNGFAAATGSAIVRVGRFRSESIRRMLNMTQFVDFNSAGEAASVVFLLVSYNPWNLFPLPLCWQRWLRRISLDLRTYSREIFRSIQIRVRYLDWRDRSTLGGLLVAIALGSWQVFNLYRWQIHRIETAGFNTRIGYVAIIILELVFNRIGRRRRLSRWEYIMRTFISLMNIPGILIFRQDDMWDRHCCLLTASSISIMFGRYLDMIHVLYTLERLAFQLNFPLRRQPIVVDTEDENLENENNEQHDEPTVADTENENNKEQNDGNNQ